MSTATMSTKGQIVIPREIRARLGWGPGTELLVESHGGTVVLRPVPFLRETSVDDLLGCLPYDGPTKTLEDMDDGVARGAREAMKRRR